MHLSEYNLSVLKDSLELTAARKKEQGLKGKNLTIKEADIKRCDPTTRRANILLKRKLRDA